MAYLGGKTGNFAHAGHKLDAGNFRIRVTQAVDAAPTYSNSIWVPHQGSGALEFFGTVGGFMKDNEASTNPNLDGISAAGGAGTFTLNTGTTYAATLVVVSGEMTNDRGRGLVPIVVEVANGGDVTETWDESA